MMYSQVQKCSPVAEGPVCSSGGTVVHRSRACNRPISYTDPPCPSSIYQTGTLLIFTSAT